MDPKNLDTQKINTHKNSHNTLKNSRYTPSNVHNTVNTSNTVDKDNTVNVVDHDSPQHNQMNNISPEIKVNTANTNVCNTNTNVYNTNANVNNTDAKSNNTPEIKLTNAVKSNTLNKENTTHSLKENSTDKKSNSTFKRVNSEKKSYATNTTHNRSNISTTNSSKDNSDKNNMPETKAVNSNADKQNVPETKVPDCNAADKKLNNTIVTNTNTPDKDVSPETKVSDSSTEKQDEPASQVINSTTEEKSTEKKVELDNVDISKIIKEIIANNRANIIPESKASTNASTFRENTFRADNVGEMFPNAEVKTGIELDGREFSRYNTAETALVTDRMCYDAQIGYKRTKPDERMFKFDNRLKYFKRPETIKNDKLIEKLQQLIVNNATRRDAMDKRDLQIRDGFERRDPYERKDQYDRREQYDTEQMITEQYIRQQLYYREDIHQGMIGIAERRGGLSWIRTSNGNLLPQIENTWLKHIITSLQSNKLALMNFFTNLEKCLIESVQFLYREGIKPYLGDVANQMKRSICDNFWSAAEVAYVSLHCKNTVKLNIELRVKGEMGWVVYLIKEPSDFKGFVDTHSTINSYDDYYWRQLNIFASSILTNNNDKVKDDKDFNGGRYAFAERLKNEVEAFRDMRLGEVVHLVQLAIYSGIFVYTQRILLPVSACEKTAQELFPKLKKSRYPVCTCINEVLKIVSLLVDNRKNGLVLAQLKQQFMLQFNRELNPLSFGYRKLQNLLLSDLFSQNYHLFVPVDSPHRTHIQHIQYPIPSGCKIFKQSKLRFDPLKFPTPLTDYYDQYYNICNKHSKSGSKGYKSKECTCLWKLEYDTLPQVVQDSIKDYLE